MQLYDLSLLLTCDLGKGVIRLHDVTRSYLIQRAGERLPVLHAHFLDAQVQTLGLTRWSGLAQSEEYLWGFLVWHLVQAVRWSEMYTTLTDLLFLTRKALYFGVPALEADLLLASTSQQADAAAPDRSFIASLHRTIRLHSHLLRQAETSAEMGSLLLSRLGLQPPFATRRSTLESELPRPFLTAWHPLPGISSSALLRTLHGHTDAVNGCAVSPDGSFIVSASWDHKLKVWDATTGAERLSLTGHTAMVNGCAVSPDGSFIVSASEDDTLKVWDATTGAERLTLTGHTDTVGSCAVSPDGSFIVSASRDKTLKVWDAQMGQCLLTFPVDGALYSCVFHPDGEHLVACGDQGVYFLRLVV